jgi:CRP-like cAMP-binding protein
VASVLFTLAALFTAWTFWGPIARSLVIALWNAGAGGRAVLALLLLLVAGPLAQAAARLLLSLARRVRRAVADLHFWSQTSWRVEGAQAIASLPLAAALTESELADLAGRIGRRRVRAGEVAVREGSAADVFHVVRSGRFVVTQRTADGSERLLRHLGAGAAFGELALLERRPRTATVRAETGGQLFSIDSGTFSRLLAPRIASQSLAPYERSLLEVWALPPFRHLSQTDAAVVAARGRWESHHAHQVVVRQGDVGDRFYVVGAGQLEVLDGGERRSVLRAGDHFGEVALLHAVPRTATVRSTTPARLFSLDAEGFRALVAGAFSSRGAAALALEYDSSSSH